MTREELERLIKAGTPDRPWHYSPWHVEEGAPAVRHPSGYIIANTDTNANAALIVAAVNALPELLERVRRLEEALKFYADPNRWPNMPNPKNPHYDLEMDAGSRARFALHARAALNQEPGQ